ncbi:prenyltransferase/squalene oxidase repeat-containing protein [Planctomycetota bacterium]
MSTSSHVQRIDEYYDEEYLDDAEEAQGPHSDNLDLIHRTPWWIISIIFHSAFLLMAAMWTISAAKEKEEFSIFEMNVKKFKKPEYDPTLKRDIKRNHKVIKDEVQVENPVITKEELEIDELETNDNMDREHKAKGRQEAMSTIELQGDGWVGVFGVGGGGSGSYGWRDGGGKRRAVGRFGGGAATESAVLAALRWFKRHQAPDGSWSYEDYSKQCKLAPPCETVDVKAYQWMAEKRINSATGFALLCFLGAGHTQKAGQFRKQVADGLGFLKQAQAADGSFARNNYTHAIATMALAEAYGMTKAASLKEIAEKAVSICLSRQNEYLGWDYCNPGSRNDTSVTGWNVMAVKSAKSAGLDVGNSFEGIKNFLDKVTPEVKGGASHPVLAGHVWYQHIKGQGGGSGHRNARLTAIGLLGRVFIGEDTKGEMLRAHGNKLLEELPDANKPDYYRTYYATLAMFQMGGVHWKKWNETMKKVLCDSQRKGGCADGSWDGVGYIGGRVGRVFTTAVGCLSLEVYYRYLPVAMLK